MPGNRTNTSPLSRRRTVRGARPSPHLARLSLAELRSYRHRLLDEEERIAYWNRLTRARIESLEGGSGVGDTLTAAELLRVLGDTATGRERAALVGVRSAGPLPELPEPAEVWRNDDPDDRAAVSATLVGLRRAEALLTDYRLALQDWLDEATAELIVRYGDDPGRAIDVLPES